MTERYALFDLMQWLSEDCRKAFEAAARIVRMPAGRIIYAQSDPGDEMYRLLAGSVRLSVIGPDGRDLLFTFFGPGACFGTSSLVDGELRPQTAEAFDSVELQVISRSAISAIRRDYPEMNDALLRLLSRHMRLLSDYFAGAALDDVAFRLAQRLVDIGDTFGVPQSGRIPLSRKISQSELASMVGAARQTVNRILQEFQRKGWVSMEAGGIVLTNFPALRDVAQKGAHLREFGY
ncbi:Crp/Fnr family transcriptional regulator [Novosphingobium album (ex Hu et al. 2023)]|uniref:Crp/Fnr family transcriptional regulator n=1 Tax=Novosphingobium album (ex Hu et al. 2023) TaxID=2930093 RepID=A0ABT0B796_9SPHN|nr:Crp/Fnr family transcriptional regulator [Novosphingobium album (ex Hu et al. 2023)]MCJ2180736.1 Crp/Fnr family transcriptional regulator [Novosphingobium album (ex Hu et al. 2023)]